MRLRPIAVCLLVVTAALTGCSSSSSSTTTTTTTVLTPNFEAKTAAVQTIAADLQLDLRSLGYQPGPVTGTFTKETSAALRSFQRAEKTPAPEAGALGPGTAAALTTATKGTTSTIAALQNALTDLNLFTGTIDGVYGPATVSAVEALQRNAKLTADGYFGPASFSAMMSAYTDQVAEPVDKPAPVPEKPSTDVLKLGSTGPAVTDLQQRLTDLGYRPGAIDGTFGAATQSAVLAFQKRNGMSRDSVVGPSFQAKVQHPTGAGPRYPSPVPHIEVDIARQIVFVVLAGGKVVTLNTSTGNGETYAVPGGGTDVAITPVGTFSIYRRYLGDEKAPLGTLHSPLYFYKGWALHGSPSVPAYPASHGCARLSNVDADWLFPLAPLGTKVYVYDSTGKSPVINALPSDAGAGS